MLIEVLRYIIIECQTPQRKHIFKYRECWFPLTQPQARNGGGCAEYVRTVVAVVVLLCAFYSNLQRKGCVRSCVPVAACPTWGFLASHTQVREEGRGEEGMINHALIPFDPQACLSEYMSPPGGSFFGISPPSFPLFPSVLPGTHRGHNHATVEGALDTP